MFERLGRQNDECTMEAPSVLLRGGSWVSKYRRMCVLQIAIDALKILRDPFNIEDSHDYFTQFEFVTGQC